MRTNAVTSLPAKFTYQITDPATNQVIGSSEDACRILRQERRKALLLP